MIRLTFALTALALAAAPLHAQHFQTRGPGPEDPLIREGEWDAGPHRFFINNNEDTEIARFKTPRLLSICAGRGHSSPTGWIKGYALKVSWDEDTAVIQPGNCLAFEAARAKVRAATPLPQNIVLEGAFTVEK